MDKVLNFLQEIFMLKKDDGIKVGLTQFKIIEETPVEKKTDVSIRTKDVKLSDLMRRAG